MDITSRIESLRKELHRENRNSFLKFIGILTAAFLVGILIGYYIWTPSLKQYSISYHYVHGVDIRLMLQLELGMSLSLNRVI
jgi:Sec-independent protein secretion pathway component TatC